MKKLLLMLAVANGALSATAQEPAKQNYTADKDLSRWVIDLNFLGGGYTQKMDMGNTTPDYLNGVNVNTGTPGFKKGMALGGDAQLGFFFGKNRHFGLGTGLMFLRESGDITLNNFHAEYQSKDNNGYTFRQVVTANNVSEHIKADNFSIPLVLKYKNRFSKHWGFTADAGALFNLQMKNSYNTNASFDYEAIYKFAAGSDGANTPVYETSPVPAANDFLITKEQYIKNNPNGNVQDYFNTKRTQGYNVGLGVTPDSKTGTVSYATGSVGFIVQPSINYFFSDKVALNIGAYYIYQPFMNTPRTDYMFTNKSGEYSSVMNAATHVNTQSYGGNLGLRFFLGRKAAPMLISSMDRNAPTICGVCNGSLVLHGLEAGKPATVSYMLNGGTPGSYSGVVDKDGTMKLPGLCAGTYTRINAKIGRKSTPDAGPASLNEAPFRISSETSSNVTVQGTCDGAIVLYGLNAGQRAYVSFDKDGVQQTTFETIVGSDNTVKLSSLCEGSYTAMTVTSNNCKAVLTSPSSIVLTAPAPLAPVVVPQAATIDIGTPILFNFNKAEIHPSSYPLLEEAGKEMKEDKSATIHVVGNTDNIGTDEYNRKLSKERAAAVKAYLTNEGVDPKRIKTVGNGEKAPDASNDTEEGRSRNRNAKMEIKK
jgi:outer membrane protein OmpA-like peptidoglycan-associated protein